MSGEREQHPANLPDMRKRELGLVVKSLSTLSERDVDSHRCEEDGRTQMNKGWELRGRHRQRYSWGLEGVKSVQG